MLRKFFKFSLMAVAVTAVAISLNSCGGDDDELTPGNENVDPSGDDGPVVVPEEHPAWVMPTFNATPYAEGTNEKNYLEETALQALNMAKPEKHREAIDLFNSFAYNYGDYDFDQVEEHLGADFSAAAHALRRGNFSAFNAKVRSIVYSLARFSGTWQADPASQQWVRVSDSPANGVTVKFRDFEANADCAIELRGGDEEWSYSEKDGDEIYVLKVPRAISLAVKKGRKNIATGTIYTDFSENQHLNVESEVNVADINAVELLHATNASIEVEAWAKINGTPLATAKLNVQGRDMVNLSVLRRKTNEFEEMVSLNEFINKISGTGSVLGRVMVDFTVTDVQAFCENADGWWYGGNMSWCDYTIPGAERAAKQAAQILNSSCKNVMRYAGSNTDRGYLTWQAYCSERYNYTDWEGNYYESEEWTTQPILHFYSDGSAYDLESYFESHNYSQVESLFWDLNDTYEDLFD